jgi:transcriptional regulator with XRE-family HTH domain
MGVVVNARELRKQMAARGLTSADLAELSRLSPPTVSHALHGRPISPRSMRAIARALDEAPACAGDLLA